MDSLNLFIGFAISYLILAIVFITLLYHKSVKHYSPIELHTEIKRKHVYFNLFIGWVAVGCIFCLYFFLNE